jgi:hypothetical protein
MSAASPDSNPPDVDPAASTGGLVSASAQETSAAPAVTGDATASGSTGAADADGDAAAAGTLSGFDRPRKGPLSLLSGALTSGLLAWLCLGLSQKVLGYYALHPPHYEARVAQSIATALKTMIVGMTFLATFSFAFVGLGLLLVFLRSLLPARPETPA